MLCKPRFWGCVSALEQHIAELSAVYGFPDRRKGPLPGGAYTMADIGLSAFSLFFMGSPSFLAHQRTLAEGQGRSNVSAIFGAPGGECCQLERNAVIRRACIVTLQELFSSVSRCLAGTRVNRS